jgi:hypothetical protein
VTRIYVNRANHDVSDSRLEYRICARSSASFCGARFQRNVKRGSGGQWRTKIAKAFNLSVIAAGPAMMSSRHDSIADDQNRANGGIRAGLTERFLCLAKRCAHEPFVSCSIHCFRKSIVVAVGRSNAAPLASLHLQRYQDINAARKTAIRPE